MQFDLPKEQSSIIKVIGVGGGGSNAVNHMFDSGIRGVNFVICNTDAQAMELSPVPNQIQLGPNLTEGLGAGSNPEVGRMATEESKEDIKELLEKNTKMVFVTAGMGGGTGTGGAPVVAKLARDMGILTVGIITTPFFFEGRRKMNQAREGIEAIRQNVDSLIVISNDKIREIYGNLTRSDAFYRADSILAIAARSISEIITVPGEINVDFADVEYVMKNSGVAIMGSAIAKGENRAQQAIQEALSSPLLNDNDIRGAEKILLNITSGKEEMLIDEITEIHELVLEAVGTDTDVIFGTCDDEALEDNISVTVIATGFDKDKIYDGSSAVTSTGKTRQQKVVHRLDKPEQAPGTVQESEQPQPQQPEQQEPTKAAEPSPSQPIVHRLDETPEEQATPQQPEQEQSEEPPADDNTDDGIRLEFRTTGSSSSQQEPPAEETAQPQQEETPEEPEEEQEPKTEPRTQQGQSFTFFFEDDMPPQQPREQAPPTPDPERRNPAPRPDMQQVGEERRRSINNLNSKLMNNPNKLTELENEPAYKRRNIQLSQPQHSSEQNVSRYTLSNDDDEEGRSEIRRNNRFLHDNVD